MHTCVMHEETQVNYQQAKMSKQRQWGSDRLRLAKRLINQCERCTPIFKRTIMITCVHMYSTVSLTHAQKVCSYSCLSGRLPL